MSLDVVEETVWCAGGACAGSARNVDAGDSCSCLASGSSKAGGGGVSSAAWARNRTALYEIH